MAKVVNVALYAQLASLIQAEYQAVGLFVDVLQQEQQLLLETHSQALLQIAEQKTQLASRINHCSEQRREVLSQVLSGHDIEGLSAIRIAELLAQENSKLQQVWQMLLDITQKAYQLNQINGELIQVRLRHNQQALNALYQAAKSPSLYGPNGQHSFAKNTGRKLGSV